MDPAPTLPRERAARTPGRDGDRVPDGTKHRLLPRVDARETLPLGEYVFYVLALLIASAWFIDFMVEIARNKPPDPLVTGVVGGLVTAFVAVPRAFRRGRKNGHDSD